ARQFKAVAVIDEFVALDPVVDRRRCCRAAAAVVAGEHDAGATAAADDAAVLDGIATGAVYQHTDTEAANLEAADLDALGVNDGEARIGQGAHVRAELTFGRAGAGALALVLNKAGSIERDEFAGAPPRHTLDTHRPLDRRKQRSRLDHEGGRAFRIDL